MEKLKLHSLADDSDGLLERLKNFNVKDAHCYDPNEETKLRHIIQANGEDEFNRRIRDMASQKINDKLKRKGSKTRFSISVKSNY